MITSPSASSCRPVMLVAVATLMLVVACSRDDKPAASDTQDPSAPTPAATGPGTGGNFSVSAPKPFTVTALTKMAEVWPIGRSISGVLVYDSVTGETRVAMEAGDGAFWHGWLSQTELLVRLGDKIGIYDSVTGSYQVLEGLDLGPNTTVVPSPDGSLLAIGTRDQNLVISDLETRTYRELSTRARPNRWSPNSSRLLLTGEEGGTHSVLELARLDRIISLPDSGYYTGWLNDFQVLANAHILIDVRFPDQPRDLPGIERGHFSPDGSLIIASHILEESGDEPRLRRFATGVYTLDPFAKIAEIPDIALCCTQTRNIWTSDSSHFVALRNLCSENEALVMVDVKSGAVTELAQGGTSQVAVSPDDRLVAFARNTRTGAWLAVVPTDGSAPPRNVTEPLGYAAADLQWSSDGRFLAFSIGGYDRCP